MKVTLLQTDIKWEDQEVNIRNAQSLMDKADPSDLYVLPEMWDTGFTMRPDAITEAKGLSWMVEMAQKRNVALCGSLIARSDDQSFRNRCYFVHPDGNVDYYDKRHLFKFGGEAKAYKAGNSQKIVSYKGFRIFLATCYDLRFPVWLRNAETYDVLLVVANWPSSRQGVWQVLSAARAIENQCYVVACNRVGEDPLGRYMGGSRIVDAKGLTVAEGSTTGEQSITGSLDLEALSEFRKKFRVLSDRDDFYINNE